MNRIHQKLLYFISALIILLSVNKESFSQRGYYDAPYKRYEADNGILMNGAVATPKSYAQTDLQSEASEQICVNMNSTDAAIEFAFVEAADGLVIRYSVPDGEEASIAIYDGNTRIAGLTLTSNWSWEYLWNNGDPNNTGIKNKNQRMRFDEVRFLLPEKLSGIKLVKESGNLWLDFIEMEIVPDEIPVPAGAAVYNGDGSTLQAFIDANGSKTIYIPAGIYNINSQLYFGVDKTKLQGAGMWYSQLNFTVTNASNGGLRANANEISYSDLYLTSDMTTRTNGYGGIIGVYTKGSVISNVWVEHCATGAWIGQYVSTGPAFADNFLITGCRFRNTFADGINLCKGTSNAVVEHCNFRNNGDDAMAIWSADGLECINNTFRYNTAENGWRAAGAALYGGKDNKFYNIVIRDNIDVGITITNIFQGVGFNDEGMHDFHDITVTACGTFNATYNDRVGAVNIYHAKSAGTKVQNIRLYNIDINDSKCDGIRMAKSSGDGIFNLVFENISVNTTGVEYPFNNAENSAAKRGFAVIFENFPLGGATYCNLNISNLGGSSDGVAYSTIQKGSFRWIEQTDCEPATVTGVSLVPVDTSIAGGSKIKLLPVFSPANATNKIVSFESADPTIATVNYEGWVTGLAKGQTTVTVTTQDGNFSSSSKINVVSDPTVYYKIKNRWQNTYLYDAGDRVRYNQNANDETFLWKLVESSGLYQIKNISSGDFMHIQDRLNYIQCTADFSELSNSKWSFENTDDGFKRIRSESGTSAYMHIENLQSHVQYGGIENTWWSAMWVLEPVLITSVSIVAIRKELDIYPNPSNGEFYFSTMNFEPNEKITIMLFSLSGQLVFNSAFYKDEDGSRQFKYDSLPTGNYIFIATGKSATAQAKISIIR